MPSLICFLQCSSWDGDQAAAVRKENYRGWLVSFTDVLSHLLTLLTQRYFLSVGLAAIVVWLGMFVEARAGSGNHVRL